MIAIGDESAAEENGDEEVAQAVDQTRQQEMMRGELNTILPQIIPH